VNIPAAFAKLRNESYARYAWPGFLAGAFARNGLVLTLLSAVCIAGFIIGFVAIDHPAAVFSPQAGEFYRLMPHLAMVWLFGAVALYCIVAFALSMWACWRDFSGPKARAGLPGLFRAVADSLHLTYLHGGGGGCTSESERPSPARRMFHHFTFYGFLFCFAATCVATIDHYVFGSFAPYPLLSVPVILGVIGGLGLVVGPIGLLVLTAKRPAELTDSAHQPMNLAFLLMLLLVSVTGLLLLGLRDTADMGILLAVHLAFVLALFLTLPYGKFVHGLYRFLALVKYAGERRHGTFVD
jgi:citrate/tricarballylate utilization protein